MQDAVEPPVPTVEAVAPFSPHERISSVDRLRAVALSGILPLNILAFGLPDAAPGAARA